MEGESPLFRRGGSLPPNLPLSPRTSPMSPPFLKWKFVSLFENGGVMGEDFCVWGGKVFCRVRLSHSFCEWDTFRRYTRHSSKVSSPNASRLQIGCEAVLCKALAPPNPKKLPQAHPPQRKRNKSLLCPGGCAWGSSRRKREVWRERDPSFKRGPSPFKVFPLLPPRSFPPYPRFFSPKKLDKRGEKGYNKSV